MDKYYYLIFIIILIALITCCSYVNDEIKNTSDSIKIAIYPTGTYAETYLFTINETGNLLVEKGTRTGDNLVDDLVIGKKDKYVYDSEMIKLSSDKVNEIVDLVNEIYEEELNTPELVTDSWEIQVLYKDKIIKENCFIGITPSLKELIDVLIDISPIKVDLRGFA